MARAQAKNPRGAAERMFAFCEEINRYGMKLACELRARRSVPIELFGLLLYLKGMNSFQGAL